MHPVLACVRHFFFPDFLVRAGFLKPLFPCISPYPTSFFPGVQSLYCLSNYCLLLQAAKASSYAFKCFWQKLPQPYRCSQSDKTETGPCTSPSVSSHTGQILWGQFFISSGIRKLYEEYRLLSSQPPSIWVWGTVGRQFKMSQCSLNPKQKHLSSPSLSLVV